jgi:hypothetical protein
MSVNKMAMQDVQQHHFVPLGGGMLWEKRAHRGSGNSEIYEFDELDRFLTTSSDPYTYWHSQTFS